MTSCPGEPWGPGIGAGHRGRSLGESAPGVKGSELEGWGPCGCRPPRHAGWQRQSGLCFEDEQDDVVLLADSPWRNLGVKKGEKENGQRQKGSLQG